MRHIMIALAALAASAFSAAAAEPFAPAVAFPATHATLAGRNIDILSLVPGMSVEKVKADLAGQYAPETITEQPTYFQGGSRGVEVRTGEFADTVKAGGSDDAITAFFVGPAADNQAFALERQVRYPDILTAPTVATITEALLAKYGEASYDSSDYGERPSPDLIWTFTGDTQVSCQGFGGYGSGDSCPVAWTLSEYEPGRLGALAAEPLDFDLAIVADIETHQADRSKVARFTVTVADLKRRKRAAEADMQALLSELERAHQEASKPAAAPSL